MPGAAHHGAAAYEVGKKVVLKGTVKQWIYSNPHCLLTLEVTGEDGQVVQWIVEGQAPNVVFPAGYRKDTFTFGDKVTITVEPVKNERRRSDNPYSFAMRISSSVYESSGFASSES